MKKDGSTEKSLDSQKIPTPYITSTQGIKIEVRPEFERAITSGEKPQYIYTYNVMIKNSGKDIVQLISRHWIIRDGLGHVEQVIGEGVVGEKPILSPGDSFEYSSFCPLETPTGSMKGTYTFKNSDGTLFEALIGEFFLKNDSLVN
jgi:ApaG protein